MNKLRKSFIQSGYDQEEAYFHKEDQRLIAKQRATHLKLVSNRSGEKVASTQVDSVPVTSKVQKKAA